MLGEFIGIIGGLAMLCGLIVIIIGMVGSDTEQKYIGGGLLMGGFFVVVIGAGISQR